VLRGRLGVTMLDDLLRLDELLMLDDFLDLDNTLDELEMA